MLGFLVGRGEGERDDGALRWRRRGLFKTILLFVQSNKAINEVEVTRGDRTVGARTIIVSVYPSPITVMLL